MSEISISATPTIAQRSPHSTTLVSFRPSPLEGEELLDLRVLNGSVALDDHQRLAGVERAAVDAPDADAADEVRIIERGDLALNRTFNLLRRRHTFENRIEQRKDRLTRIVEIPDRPAVAAGSVKQRELQLLVARIQLAEEVEHLRVDRIGPGVRPCRSC